MSRIISIVILDDEKLLGLNLENRLNEICKYNKIEITVFTNPFKAKEHLQSHSVDVLFLDINMPKMSGFELLQQLENPEFEVVFVTAHDQFAIRAFKAHAVDYLLKPIDDDELANTWTHLKAILNSKNIKSDFSDLKLSVKNQTIDFIKINHFDGFMKIEISEIVLVLADGNYSEIFTSSEEKPIVVTKQIGELETIIAQPNFIRVHKSVLFNSYYKSDIKEFKDGTAVLNTNTAFPISRRRKQHFLQLLNE